MSLPEAAELSRRAAVVLYAEASVWALARELGIGGERGGTLAAEFEAERTDVAGHHRRALARLSDDLAALGQMAAVAWDVPGREGSALTASASTSRVSDRV